LTHRGLRPLSLEDTFFAGCLFVVPLWHPQSVRLSAPGLVSAALDRRRAPGREYPRRLRPLEERI